MTDSISKRELGNNWGRHSTLTSGFCVCREKCSQEIWVITFPILPHTHLLFTHIAHSLTSDPRLSLGWDQAPQSWPWELGIRLSKETLSCGTGKYYHEAINHLPKSLDWNNSQRFWPYCLCHELFPHTPNGWVFFWLCPSGGSKDRCISETHWAPAIWA